MPPRPWASVLEERGPAFEVWPGDNRTGRGWCDNRTVLESACEVASRAEELGAELRLLAIEQPSHAPLRHVVLVTHASFVGELAQVLLGRPTKHPNANVVRLQVARTGTVILEEAVLPKG